MHPLLAILLPLIGGLVGGGASILYRRWRQKRCHHTVLVMDPGGRSVCLTCLKRNH